MKSSAEKYDGNVAAILGAMNGNDASAVEFSVMANGMPASQEKAPYLGRARAVGSCTQRDVAERSGELGCQVDVEEFMRILDATGAYLVREMPKIPRPYDLCFVRLKPVMGGVFYSADEDFDPERHSLYVSAVPSAGIRAALSGGTPSRADGSQVLPAIGNVSYNDAADTIKSGEPFVIVGKMLTFGAGDESIELELPDGQGRVPVIIDERSEADGVCQRITGHLAHVVSACEGAVLYVNTHGLDLESSMKHIPSSKITILAGETPPEPTPPTLTEVKTDGMDSGQIVWDDDIKIVGSNLALGTGGKVEAQIEDSGDAWTDLSSYVDGEASGSGLIVLKGARGSETDEGVWNALGEMELPTTEGRVRFRVTTNGGEDTIVAETVG